MQQTEDSQRKFFLPIPNWGKVATGVGETAPQAIFRGYREVDRVEEAVEPERQWQGE